MIVRRGSRSVWLGSSFLLLAAIALVADEPRLWRDLPAASGQGRQAAILTASNQIFVASQPLPGEGLYALSRRLCGGEACASELRKENGGSTRLLAGRWYRLALSQLEPALRRRALAALFPRDRPEASGWRHRVATFKGFPDDTLWRIAERFTGRGHNYRQIREANGLVDDTVYPGQEIVIPEPLLLAAFRTEVAALPAAPAAPVAEAAEVEEVVDDEELAQAPTLDAPAGPLPAMAKPAIEIPNLLGVDPGSAEQAATEPPPSVVVRAVDARAESYGLSYGSDAQGEYALYRLKRKEALYSSVVVRFTGRIYAADVNALAAEIAARSGVTDVTDMPIGYPVKIPFEVLQPEFLPLDHPRRREFEESQQASAQFSNPVRSLDLSGITDNLDAGHGGRDAGATKSGVWESTYVYDVMVRLKRYLEENTSAEVLTTTRDGGEFRITERDVLPFSQGHHVLTTPPYSLLEDSRVGVNLRWYLANSQYRRALSKGGKPEHVVFLSIHADSLHPSLRGAMAYIPDARLREGSFEKSGPAYATRREVQERPRVAYSWQHRVKSEGLSRQLALQVIESFRTHHLPVHPEQPVRQKIYRGRRPWVPAVLRYNEVPAGLLLEIGNLANEHDRKAISSREFRERVAVAIGEGIRAYYATTGRGAGVAVAAKAK